jgi:putative chitinase
MLVTPKELQLIEPSITPERAEALCDHFDFIFPKYGIKRGPVLNILLVNLLHESGAFKHKEENMNYSAARILAVWPSRFKNINAAQHFAHNPKALANFVYGSRMGNIPGTDDGYNFRGGGFIGITGRSMYEKYRQYVAFDTVEKVADAIRTDDYYAMDSACWIFSVVLKLNATAEKGNMEACVRAINGGLIGMDNRMDYLQKCNQYML